MLQTFSIKYPALTAVIPLIIGIAISYYMKFKLSFLPEWLYISVLVALVIFIFLLYPKTTKGELFLFPYLMLILLFGLFSFQYRFYKSEPDNVSLKIKGSISNSVIKGTIAEQPDINDERIRFLIEVSSLNDTVTNGNVLVTVYKNKFKEDELKKLRYGDIIDVKGKAGELPNERNPGEFDYGRYLKLHSIDAVFTSYGFENITLAGHNDPNVFQSFVIIPVKEYSIKTIDELIGGQ